MSEVDKQRRFLERFEANKNAHGLQQANGSYIAVRECITDKILQDHFNGTQTLGIYTTNPANNTSKYLCIDIDDDHQTTEFNRLLNYFNINNLVYLRESVRPGRLGHVWLFFDRPVDTALVHRLGIYACMLAGLKAEVFPKQASIKTTRLGNLCRLPLGVHKKTGKRGLFLDCPIYSSLKQDKLNVSCRRENQLDWFLQQPVNNADLVVELVSTLPALVEKPSHKRKTTVSIPLLAKFPSDYHWKESGNGELIGRCPRCAASGFDRTGNNLCINIDKNVLFCHRGCGFIEIMRSLRV